MCYTELEPKQQQYPREQCQAQWAEGGQRTGYMKLKTLEVKSPDGYTKARQYKSMEGE